MKKAKVISMFYVCNILLFSFILSCTTTPKSYDVSLSEDALIAEDLVAQGAFDQALVRYKKAFLAYEDGKDEMGMLYCLERMGWIKRELGDYGEALRIFRKAYPMGVRLNGDAAEIDADIGDVYLFSGDSKKARKHYQESLRTLKDFVFKTSYSRPPGGKEITSMVRKCTAIIHARSNLGMMHYFAKEYNRALEDLKAADDLINRISVVAEHPLYGIFFNLPMVYYEGVGYCQTMMGATYGEMGRFEKAWQHFDIGGKAFQHGKKPFGLLVNRALRFKIEFLRADVKIEREQFIEYEQFLEKAESMGAMEILWRMCYEIGRALAKEKEYPEARKYLRRAIDTLENMRSNLREDTIKKMFATSVQEVYGEMISLLYEMKRYEEGFDYLERAKARAFLDMLGGRSLKAKKSVDPLLIEKEKNLQQRIDVMIRRLRRSGGAETDTRGLKTVKGPAGKSEYEAYKNLIEDRRQILEAIKSQSLEFAATTTVTTVPANKVVSRLGKGTALISYFLDREKTLVWLMDKGTISALSVKIGFDKLGGMISDYRKAITSRDERLVAELGEKLSNLLIKPIMEKIKGADHLLIIPSKTLHYLPFSSLPLSRDRFLVESYSITILPNASSLFFLDKKVTADRKTLFAMGNPERITEASLEYADREVESISKTFSRSTLLTGKDAKESVLKERDLIDTGILHIAAHGTYDPNDPLKSALLLAKDQRDDGNLETFEIFSITMNPRLVVLSACRSGVGKVEGGDEVQSLNRAFLYAGAGGVVASLWSVSDQSTYRLMEYFYEGLSMQSPADALQNAQIKLMKEYSSPFYWAPFYLTGGMEK